VSARVLFAAWPFPGHLLPQVGIARALRERGHEVAFYSGESARPMVEQAGFELHPFQCLSEQRVERILHPVDGAGRRGGPPAIGLLGLLREWLVETMPAQIADLQGLLGRWRADVIASDVSLWAPTLVLWEAERIPVAACGTLMGPTIPGPDAPAFGLRPARTPLGRLGMAALTRSTELLATRNRRRVDQLRAQHGLRELGESINRYFARLPLYLVGNVRELDYERRDLPASVHYVGPCAWYPDDDATARRLEQIPTTRPWVHVTESTTASGEPFLLRTAVEALAGEPVEVIVTTGRQRNRAVLDWPPLPANVHVAPWLSHGQLLPRCAALVTLGGTSTVLAAAQAGVPMVLVPHAWDRPDNARRVTETGAGVRLSARRLDAGTLRAGVRKVLDEPSYRQAAQRLAAAVAVAPGPGRAAELLERLAAQPAAAAGAAAAGKGAAAGKAAAPGKGAAAGKASAAGRPAAAAAKVPA